MDRLALPPTLSAARALKGVRAAALAIIVITAAALCNPQAGRAAPLSEMPTQSVSPAADTTDRQIIDDTSEAGSDARIRQRIEGIFAALPALSGIRVEVSAGVVSLSGSVPSAEDIDRAEEIASRIAGVVTVENAVSRAVSVEGSIESLGSVSGWVRDFLRLLPLIGVAALVAAVISAIGYGLAASTWLWQRIAPNGFLAELIASALRFVFVTGGIVVALQMIGAGALLGAVLGGAGIVGIALGFAMRDTIENYVASIMLSLRQPFRANDWVRIEEHEGRVIRLTSRATVIMTLDGNHLRIPNSTVFKAVILNFTRNPRRRFDFDLGIDADSDPNRARRIGLEALAALDFVLTDPPPSARLEYVGDSNIVLKFLGWIDQDESDFFKARSLAVPAVKSALEDAGFALPEPIYRLRFDSAAIPALPEPRSRPAPTSAAADPAGPPRGPEPDEAAAPQDVIAMMVDHERRTDGGGEKDLLDGRRPIE
jgi:small conductance mechanosensitive channel